MPNKPIITVRDGKLSCSIFSHTDTDAQGNSQERISASFQRSYKKKGSDDWERQGFSCYPEELLRIAELLRQAHWQVVDYAAQKRKEGWSTGNYPSSALNADTPPDDITADDSIPF